MRTKVDEYLSNKRTPAGRLNQAGDGNHRFGIGRGLLAKPFAHLSGEGHANVKVSIALEDLREHADVLEIYNPETILVEKEVVRLDVRVADTTTVVAEQVED